MDRNGKVKPLPQPPRSYLFPRISPDGKQIAFEVEGVNHDLFVYDPARGVTTKMTTGGVSYARVWTADGRRLAFRSWKAGTMTMWWMPAGRSAPEERLTNAGVARQSLVGFSPDGRYAAYNEMEPGRGRTFASSRFRATGSLSRWPGPGPKIQISSEGGTDPMWSPDGKELFYRNDDRMMAVPVSTVPTFKAG